MNKKVKKKKGTEKSPCEPQEHWWEPRRPNTPNRKPHERPDISFQQKEGIKGSEKKLPSYGWHLPLCPKGNKNDGLTNWKKKNVVTKRKGEAAAPKPIGKGWFELINKPDPKDLEKGRRVTQKIS